MTPVQIEEVWDMLDRDYLASVARETQEPVFATISGAHLYGFASADSDVDMRGAFMLPARRVLGLHPPRETVEIHDTSILDLDWVAHDIRKFARMMTCHNGYALEQLFSPLVVLSTPAHEELMTLGMGCVAKPIVRHYQGFARRCRLRLETKEPTIKRLLYAYRALLTGIHAMRTGRIVANLLDLNGEFRIKEVDDLIEQKRAGEEKMPIAQERISEHTALLDDLENLLQQAHAASRLPDEITCSASLDDFVVRLRLSTVSEQGT